MQDVQEDGLVAHHFIHRYCNRLGCCYIKLEICQLHYCGTVSFRNFKVPGYFVTIYINFIEGFG
jgi:hypothetical protein